MYTGAHHFRAFMLIHPFRALFFISWKHFVHKLFLLECCIFVNKSLINFINNIQVHLLLSHDYQDMYYVIQSFLVEVFWNNLRQLENNLIKIQVRFREHSVLSLALKTIFFLYKFSYLYPQHYCTKGGHTSLRKCEVV